MNSISCTPLDSPLYKIPFFSNNEFFDQNFNSSVISSAEKNSINLNKIKINVTGLKIGNLILRFDYSMIANRYLKHVMIVTSINPFKVAHCTRDYSTSGVLFRGAVLEGIRAFMPQHSTTHEIIFNVYQLQDSDLAEKAAYIAEKFSEEDCIIDDLPMTKNEKENKFYVGMKSCFKYEDGCTKLSFFNWRATHRTIKALGRLNKQLPLSKNNGRSCSQFIAQCFHIAALLRVIESQDTSLMDHYSKKILEKNMHVKTKDIPEYFLAIRSFLGLLPDNENTIDYIKVLHKIRVELERCIPPIFQYDPKTYCIDVFEQYAQGNVSLSHVGHIQLQEVEKNFELHFTPT
ncbi:MAG: hypothetical protein V4629_07825 [Pseudomonadota bacterium]